MKIDSETRFLDNMVLGMRFWMPGLHSGVPEKIDECIFVRYEYARTSSYGGPSLVMYFRRFEEDTGELGSIYSRHVADMVGASNGGHYYIFTTYAEAFEDFVRRGGKLKRSLNASMDRIETACAMNDLRYQVETLQTKLRVLQKQFDDAATSLSDARAVNANLVRDNQELKWAMGKAAHDLLSANRTTVTKSTRVNSLYGGQI